MGYLFHGRVNRSRIAGPDLFKSGVERFWSSMYKRDLTPSRIVSVIPLNRPLITSSNIVPYIGHPRKYLIVLNEQSRYWLDTLAFSILGSLAADANSYLLDLSFERSFYVVIFNYLISVFLPKSNYCCF